MDAKTAHVVTRSGAADGLGHGEGGSEAGRPDSGEVHVVVVVRSRLHIWETWDYEDGTVVEECACCQMQAVVSQAA